MFIVTSAHLDTMTTGTSCDLQYWKNSLKPESSLMSAGDRRGRSHMGRCSRLADGRTIFEHLLAFFEGMSVLANALEHLLKGFAAVIREFQCAVPSAQRPVSKAHTGTLCGQRGSPSFPLVSFLCRTRENQSCLCVVSSIEKSQ